MCIIVYAYIHIPSHRKVKIVLLTTEVSILSIMDQLMSIQSFMEVYPKIWANYNRIPKPESFGDFGN